METKRSAVPSPPGWIFSWHQINVRTGLLATIVFLLAYLVVKQSRKKWNTPPGPRAWWPILGHLPSLDRVSPYRTLAELTKTYGPIVSLKFGSFPVVVLNSYALVHQAFVKQGHKFDDRPKMTTTEMFKGRGQNGKSIFYLYLRASTLRTRGILTAHIGMCCSNGREG